MARKAAPAPPEIMPQKQLRRIHVVPAPKAIDSHVVDRHRVWALEICVVDRCRRLAVRCQLAVAGREVVKALRPRFS